MRFKVEGTSTSAPTTSGAAITVNGATEVMVRSTDAAATYRDVYISGGTAFVIGGGEMFIIVKKSTETLYAAHANVKFLHVNTRVM
jgi:hypothetical protein